MPDHLFEVVRGQCLKKGYQEVASSDKRAKLVNIVQSRTKTSQDRKKKHLFTEKSDILLPTIVQSKNTL